MGTLAGTVVGFVLGAAAGLVFFYLVFMVPKGQPFSVIDQGVLIIWLTGPAGAIAGSLIGRRLARRSS